MHYSIQFFKTVQLVKPFTYQASKNWRRNECHQFKTAENEAVFCSCTSFFLRLKHTTYNNIIINIIAGIYQNNVNNIVVWYLYIAYLL